MRNIIIVLIMLCGLGVTTKAQDIDLYDSQGIPQAFISTDLVIYAWDGTPTSYIHQKGGIWYIYAFSGKHLGFYKNGAILNDEGEIVGAAEGKNPNIQVSAVEIPLKGDKQTAPTRQPRKAATALAKTKPLVLEKASLRITLIED